MEKLLWPKLEQRLNELLGLSGHVLKVFVGTLELGLAHAQYIILGLHVLLGAIAKRRVFGE